MALGITTRTYFDLREVGGVLPIADPTSSQAGVGDDAIGLDKDYFSIVKPCSARLESVERRST